MILPKILWLFEERFLHTNKDRRYFNFDIRHCYDILEL